jgi:hypothetical protein
MSRASLFLAIAALALVPATNASADAEDDRAAAQEIAQAMKDSGQLKDYRVGVKYQDGVAWLMGTVTSLEQKEIAEQVARETAGVENVINKLEVSSAGASSPRQATRSKPAQDVRQANLQAPPAQRLGARQASANMPVPYARTMQGQVQGASYGGYCPPGMGGMGGPVGMTPTPMGNVPAAVGQAVSYDNPQMPGYAWPSYAAYPNYAALTYPQQYSPTAWPYIGPFYPYPQVPLGWRKVTLEWDDGWWMLDFNDCKDCHF